MTKTCVNKYCIANPTINPVTTAGKNFCLVNFSNPQIVTVKKAVVIQAKEIIRSCNKMTNNSVATAIRTAALMPKDWDSSSAVDPAAFLKDSLITRIQQNIIIPAVACGTGADPNGSNVPGGKPQDSQRKIKQIRVIRLLTPISYFC